MIPIFYIRRTGTEYNLNQNIFGTRRYPNHNHILKYTDYIDLTYIKYLKYIKYPKIIKIVISNYLKIAKNVQNTINIYLFSIHKSRTNYYVNFMYLVMCYSYLYVVLGKNKAWFY